MRITLIGAGNVATVLGSRMLESGHVILQVYSRTLLHARSLANTLSATAVEDPKEISPAADLYLVAVPDDALHGVHEWLRTGDSLVVHTAGSVPMNVLKNVSTHYGVLYPLQSLRKEITEGLKIPVLVDGSDPWTRTRLLAFAQSFAERVGIADDAQRSKLHLAAVISNNFSNHLFALAEEYCKKEGLDFEMLFPLLEQTVQRLAVASPAIMQTGPASRKDETTIMKHRQMLADHPELRELYDWFTRSIASDVKRQT